ncbi:MAG: hypothetical protein JXA44_10580 [Methanospirillaceae archaeon]|nr:hypothetical protein [Methanospirillaceae archaeon]
MGKKIQFQTISFGSEPETPTISQTADFVSKNQGYEADLTTVLLSSSLNPQKEAGINQTCAGGVFYRDRFSEFLRDNDPSSIFSEDRILAATHEDACHCVREVKHTTFALPGPSRIPLFAGIPDADWADDCFAFYRSVRRSMRDAGIQSHVIHDNCTDPDVISGLSGQKVLFFPDNITIPVLENLLEVQRTIAVSDEEYHLIPTLLDRYDLKKITLLQPEAGTIQKALTLFDPDQILVGGYKIAESGIDYWEEIVTASSYPG